MRLLPLLLALLPLSGCSLLWPGDGGGTACTDEFRVYTVQVVDAGGQPLDDLAATVRNLRTGDPLDLDATDVHVQHDGRYLVATDGHQEQLSARGDQLLFRAVGDGLVAEAVFVFAAGPCHVEKVSGPERIVAQPE